MSRMSSLSSLTSLYRLTRNDKQQATVQRAASSGDIETLRKASLKELNRKSAEGETSAIHAASMAGQLSALRLLVERGVKVNQPDANGNTPLHHAVINGQTSCAVFLVFFGANLWSRNDQLDTALAIALRRGDQNLVNFLDDTAARLFTEDPTRVAKLRRKAECSARQRLHTLDEGGSEEAITSSRSTSSMDEIRSQWKLRTVPKMMTSQLNSTLTLMPRESNGNSMNKTTCYESNIRRGEGDRTQINEIDIVFANIQARSLRKRLRYQRQLQRHEAHISTLGQPVHGRSTTFQTTPGPFDASHTNRSMSVDRRGFSKTGTLLSTQSADGSALYCSVPHIVMPKSPRSIELQPDSKMTLPPERSMPLTSPEIHKIDTGHSVTSARDRSRVHRECSYNLAEFLISLDLGDYLQVFSDERIDIESICLLNEDDLLKLGLPLGPRRKLLHALWCRQMDSTKDKETKDVEIKNVENKEMDSTSKDVENKDEGSKVVENKERDLTSKDEYTKDVENKDVENTYL